MSVLLAATIAIVGGTVHPGDGPALEAATVLIEGDRITAVGVGAQVPAGAQVIDARGKVVTPGFIDAFTHLGLVEVWAVERSRDIDAGGHWVRAAQRAADSFNPDSVVIPSQRIHGITAVVAAPVGGLVAGQAGLFELAGSDTGAPSAGVPSAGIVVTLGGATASTRGARLLALREVLDDARLFRDNREAWERNQYRRLAASHLDLEALQPVLAGRLPLLVRVHRRSDIRAVIRLARELDVRVVLIGATEAWMVAKAIAEAGIPVVLDPTENLPWSLEAIHARADAAALLDRAGVQIALSTLGAVHNVRKLRQWAGNAVREGLDHAAALRAVTAHPASIYQISDQGTLEPGKRANVVVWSGDPFELSTRAEQVLIGGRSINLRDRQRALAERYLKIPGAPARSHVPVNDD